MKIQGGFTSYGHVAGILMSDSAIPRIPGDPGHAGTFDFPVLYESLKGFPFQDLVEIRKDNLDILLASARKLESRGVHFIAADCGLFGPFQEDLSSHLNIPFIGSALDLVPMLLRHCPGSGKIGILTGDTGILQAGHLTASGIQISSVRIAGMESCPEFRRVVIQREPQMDVDQMRLGVIEAAQKLNQPDVHAIVLECTNLIPFRLDIQKSLQKPVFDLVTLMEFYASGFRKHRFRSQFI